MAFELGIYHFDELAPDPTTHEARAPAVRLRELIEQAEVADDAGLSGFLHGAPFAELSRPPLRTGRRSSLVFNREMSFERVNDPMREGE